jgi:fused signal recognition particle receptor
MGFFNLFRSGDKNKEDAEKQELDKSLEKTKAGFFSKISRALVGKSTVDDAFLDDLEEILVSSDVGIDTTIKIIEKLEERVARDKFINTKELNSILREEIQTLLASAEEITSNPFELEGRKTPYVIMVVGVNGVGKTTTIGKLAYQFKAHGKSVVMGAADTFRAAAIDQLKIWAQRVDVPIVHREMGSDPASVAYDTVQSALAKGNEVVILDTAGRLHNKVGLMNELSKVERSVQKLIPDGPHEILLVLDASTGQNAFEQARKFIEATHVNTLAITKLDGTAKAGVVIGVVDQFKIPVKYIGVGEKMEDLQVFDRVSFVNSLFEEGEGISES